MTKLLAREPGFHSRQGAGNYCLRHPVQTDPGTHPASYPIGTGGKAAGALKLMAPWSYTSTSPYAFTAWCLIKHKIRSRSVVLS